MATKKETAEMAQALHKAVAVYDLLHVHAAGKTCLTEDQLANVVTGVADEARDLLRRVRGEAPRAPEDAARWIVAHHRRPRLRPRRGLH